MGVKTAAVMLLMPRMVSILMEGLAPISGAANSFVQKHFPGREVIWYGFRSFSRASSCFIKFFIACAYYDLLAVILQEIRICHSEI
nr:PTS transporter subunit IIC [Streptococcus dysgalactiae]